MTRRGGRSETLEVVPDEREPRVTRAVAWLIAALLIVAGLVAVIGANSIRFTHRETGTSCFELQGENLGVPDDLNALASARLTDFPLGLACEWQTGDGSTFVQHTWFVQESVFVALGLAAIAFAVALIVRSRRYPAAIAA